jgi:hypothetical protein
MQMKKLAFRFLRAVRTTCGLALVLAAFSCSAFAGGPTPAPAPEIDPGSLGSALALLAGGVAMLTDRFRRN